MLPQDLVDVFELDASGELLPHETKSFFLQNLLWEAKEFSHVMFEFIPDNEWRTEDFQYLSKLIKKEAHLDWVLDEVQQSLAHKDPGDHLQSLVPEVLDDNHESPACGSGDHLQSQSLVPELPR